MDKLNRLPFDWKNPVGYLIAAIIQHIIVLIVFAVIACFTAWGVSMYMFEALMAKDIRKLLYSLNRNAQTNKNKLQAMQQLRIYITFHGDLKQLSESDFLGI